jgi:glycosyltransferase involved in cell wall biosynthesis
MKVGIVVSQDFFHHHVGVRNYVLGLGTILSETMRVDYLAQQPNHSGAPQWYQMQPVSRRFVNDNSVAALVRFDGSPLKVLHDFRSHQSRPQVGMPAIPCLAIGTDLASENYDVLIISSPWCVDFAERLPAGKIIGLAHDTIPNTIGFTTWDIRPFSFAAEHTRGYRYYRKYADLIYTNSRDTADCLAEYFAIPADKLFPLPPFLPIGYLGMDIPKPERGANLALAGPFDPRKGMALIPELVNLASKAMDKLLIYGLPRCDEHQVDKFFGQLDQEIEVVWCPFATTQAVASLFAESRLLLFPSHREGLGLPILEAQISGARVAAFPISPMIDNMLPGSISLGESVAENAEHIVAVLLDKIFDHAGLAESAAAKFRFNNIRDALISTVTPGEYIDLAPTARA